MERLHLFELEDQNWFPTFLRNYGTDFLQFISIKTGMFKPIVPVLEEALKKSGTTEIIDLGSGGGGGLVGLNEELRKKIPELRIVLTDYFPNLTAFEKLKEDNDNIDFIYHPVDARNVPSQLKGLRTQFLSFHHFKPADAKLILQNAVDSKSSIAIFEGQERSIAGLIGIFFSPFLVLLSTPFIRPFKLGRIVFTYLMPLVPLFVFWDGFVSVLRTYSVKEMKTLVESLEGKDTHEWEIGRKRSGPGWLLYLVGIYKAER